MIYFLHTTNTKIEATQSSLGICKAKFVRAEAAYNKSVADLAAANKEYEAAFEKVMELEG